MLYLMLIQNSTFYTIVNRNICMYVQGKLARLFWKVGVRNLHWKPVTVFKGTMVQPVRVFNSTYLILILFWDDKKEQMQSFGNVTKIRLCLDLFGS